MGSAVPRHTVIGAILAGGRGTRLGGVDKAFIIWRGEPLITRVARRLRGHCSGIIVVANGDLGRFAPVGLAAIADRPHPTLSGARRGLATAFSLLDRAAEGAVLFTTPTDLPDLPFDLVWRLKAAMAITGAPAACAESDGRLHPLVALWTPSAAERALAHLAANRDASVAQVHHAIGSAIVTFPARPCDPFRNINRPDDLAGN